VVRPATTHRPGQPIADHQVRRSNPGPSRWPLQLAGFGWPTDRHCATTRRVQAGIGELLAVNGDVIPSGGVSAGASTMCPPRSGTWA
jgi:hypothetical protein